MALSRFTMTFARDIAIAPFARLTVTIIGSISGVRPTATATANSSASSQSCLVAPLIMKTSGPITMINRIIGELTKKCLGPGMENQANAVTAYYIGPHKADIWQVERIDYAIIAHMRIFLSRHCFAS